MNLEETKRQIKELVRHYVRQRQASVAFMPGQSPVPYAGRVYDDREVVAGVDSLLDFWLTLGAEGEAFERGLAKFVGVRHAVLVNSGSSANLLAVASLTSPLLDRPLKAGDEVLTVAAGFPTTVAPIVQHNLVPVFVDVDLSTANVRADRLSDAVGAKTRAIMLAHTLGNPFDVDAVLDVARRHELYVIEDNCDALGSRYRGRPTGSFGDLATQSFFPPHHITMGEGGAVLTQSGRLKRIVESFRDWGRDCWCPAGQDNTCQKRFEWQLGDLPAGFDHKYIYSHRGYNLKPLDVQAAIGRCQLDKLDAFGAARRANHARFRTALRPYEEFLILPDASVHGDPSWFGFLLIVRPGAPFDRGDLVQFLESRRIQTRPLFAGNLLRQPAFRDIPRRVVGGLENTDTLMRDAFFIGVYPGLTPAMLDYVEAAFADFFHGLAMTASSAGLSSVCSGSSRKQGWIR